jgi:hypothetical protein
LLFVPSPAGGGVSAGLLSSGMLLSGGSSFKSLPCGDSSSDSSLTHSRSQLLAVRTVLYLIVSRT